MKQTDFLYAVDTKKSFDEAVIAVLKAIEKQGWALFQIYDVKERLAAKGFEHERLKIIEICSAKHANKFLQANKFVSLCMPCKINVIESEGYVKIAGMKPTLIAELFSEISKKDAEAAENEVIAIINDAK